MLAPLREGLAALAGVYEVLNYFSLFLFIASGLVILLNVVPILQSQAAWREVRLARMAGLAYLSLGTVAIMVRLVYSAYNYFR